MKRYSSALAVVLSLSLLEARQIKVTCGSYPDKGREEAHLHGQAERSGAKYLRKSSTARMDAGERLLHGTSIRADVGNVAVLEDAGGVVARRNVFDLSQRSLRFIPTGAGNQSYRYEVGPVNYDRAAETGGTRVADLEDDDTHEIRLPFAFPFYGTSHSRVFINSDGNLTFNSGDSAISDRSLGRLNAGAPRIAPLFLDLDPSVARTGVVVYSAGDRLVVSWVEVPEYRESGNGPAQTFQAALFPDGRIEFAYETIRGGNALVGISPGGLLREASIVDFSVASAVAHSFTVVERFTDLEEIDMYAAAQKFYANHEDAYDYIVVYNNLGIAADEDALAYEFTLRNRGSGYGYPQWDTGTEAGSPRRLQAVINMGSLNSYPKDPNGKVPIRLTSGDTPLTVLGHEIGHLFLSYASVRDPRDPDARPMLGHQLAHWNFQFNAEASLMEGNRIRDNGPGTSPRFITTAAVEGYSALDQYLMGFRPPEEVPDTFLVTDSFGTSIPVFPQVGVTFNGNRRDIRIGEIIEAEGRRTPDHTVSQRRFRVAFILVTAAGQDTPAADVAQIDTYRRELEPFFARITGGRATVDTSIKGALAVSTFPAAGVVQGQTAPATVRLDKASALPVTVLLRSSSGAVQVPPSVTIPAGSMQASFSITGMREGVDDLVAEPAGSQYEVVHSKIQVARPSSLKLKVHSGDLQAALPGVALSAPVQFRLTDLNDLPYAGLPVQVTIGGGGTTDTLRAVTDAAGTVSFRWTPGTGTSNELRATVAGGAEAVATAIGRPAVPAGSVVNAASYQVGVSPGSIATVFGANLTDGSQSQVKLNGQPVPVFFSGAGQVNFYVPADLQGTTAQLTVQTAIGTSEPVQVPVLNSQPGIFFNSGSGFGAIVVSGRSQVTQESPGTGGDVLEVYSTGLGAVRTRPDGLKETVVMPQVTIAGVPAEVLFSGLSPNFQGLYQINVRVASGVPPGDQVLRIELGGVGSNEVRVRIR